MWVSNYRGRAGCRFLSFWRNICQFLSVFSGSWIVHRKRNLYAGWEKHGGQDEKVVKLWVEVALLGSEEMG